MKRLILIALPIAALALSACGETVPAGYAGVKVRTLFNAGTDEHPLAQGFHLTGLGEEIHSYPTKQRLYSYTAAPDLRGRENEEMLFNDQRGLQMSGDVQVQAATRADCVPELFNTWRTDFDDLIAGPIRLDVQAAISVETEKTTVEALYSGGRQAVLASALKPVATKWKAYCVDITQLGWAGPIRYPRQISDAIMQKTATDQATQNAVAQVLQKKAEADAAIEAARGVAESNAIIGKSLAQNPGLLRQQWIAAWREGGAKLPNTLITDGEGAELLLQLKE